MAASGGQKNTITIRGSEQSTVMATLYRPNGGRVVKYSPAILSIRSPLAKDLMCLSAKWKIIVKHTYHDRKRKR